LFRRPFQLRDARVEIFQFDGLGRVIQRYCPLARTFVAAGVFTSTRTFPKVVTAAGRVDDWRRAP
jgi:hypothetical protein